MLNITNNTTVGELLSQCGQMSLEDLKDLCLKYMEDHAIDTEGELVSEETSPISGEDIVDTVGLGIIPGGKAASSQSNINKVAKLFARKLRGL